jgi:hypothetical protein
MPARARAAAAASCVTANAPGIGTPDAGTKSAGRAARTSGTGSGMAVLAAAVTPGPRCSFALRCLRYRHQGVKGRWVVSGHVRERPARLVPRQRLNEREAPWQPVSGFPCTFSEVVSRLLTSAGAIAATLEAVSIVSAEPTSAACRAMGWGLLGLCCDSPRTATAGAVSRLRETACPGTFGAGSFSQGVHFSGSPLMASRARAAAAATVTPRVL